MHYLLFIFFSLLTTELPALLDLDKMEQSYILETKRIHIPSHPHAFNPAIVRWKGRLLMSFRSRDPSTNLATLVGFTWLDSNFNPVGEPQLLNLIEGEIDGNYIQDPRLIVRDDQLYMAYSDLVEDPQIKRKKRKMCLCEIHYDGVRFLATHEDCFHDFDGDITNKFEKNWVPFNYYGNILLAYTISPHKIFLPLMGEKKCATLALLIDQNYLAFFHSSLNLETVQSKGKSMPHYFMGAYLFENEPPFSIKKISPHPIVSKHFYNGIPYQTWKPLQVIFPCGFVYDNEHIWVSYGRQDHEAWIIKLDRANLLKSLVPFETL
jgi:predicted GH43/DUF377 family glycosyl hydrolase